MNVASRGPSGYKLPKANFGGCGTRIGCRTCIGCGGLLSCGDFWCGRLGTRTDGFLFAVDVAEVTAWIYDISYSAFDFLGF